MEESQIILPALAGSNLHLVFEMIWFALEKTLSDGAEVAGTAKYTLASLARIGS
jgi:hypothetical protein